MRQQPNACLRRAARAMTLGGVVAATISFASLADMVGHGGVIRSVAISADGRTVLTASFDYSARLWQFDEQRELALLDGHDGPVNDAIFLDGGSRAATVGADGKVLVWDLTNGTLEAELPSHHGRAIAAAVSADGKLLLSGGWDGRLVLSDFATHESRLEIETGAPVTGVGFARGGRAIVSGGTDGVLHVWRSSDGAAVASFGGHELGVTKIIASADGRWLLSIGQDDTARLWDLERLSLRAEYTPLPERNPIAAALAPDGGSLLLAYLDGEVLQLDAASGSLKGSFQAEDGPVWGLVYSADGRFALTAGAEERVKVWHLETGDRISVAAEGKDARPEPWLESRHPGARLFRKCAGCHALALDEHQRSGPHFSDLFGRRAGVVEGYRYSRALQGSEIVWTRESLTALFREGPDRYLPGTKMPVQRVTDEAELRDLIDYLELITHPG